MEDVKEWKHQKKSTEKAQKGKFLILFLARETSASPSTD